MLKEKKLLIEEIVEPVCLLLKFAKGGGVGAKGGLAT